MQPCRLRDVRGVGDIEPNNSDALPAQAPHQGLDQGRTAQHLRGKNRSLDSHASFACLLNQKLDIIGSAPDRDAAQGLPNLMGYGRDDSVDVEWACKSCLPKPDEAVGIRHLANHDCSQ